MRILIASLLLSGCAYHEHIHYHRGTHLEYNLTPEDKHEHIEEKTEKQSAPFMRRPNESLYFMS